ncbi:NFX1-type zinc finger-containing protein 1 [Biomphalaria glabrata]
MANKKNKAKRSKVNFEDRIVQWNAVLQADDLVVIIFKELAELQKYLTQTETKISENYFPLLVKALGSACYSSDHENEIVEILKVLCDSPFLTQYITLYTTSIYETLDWQRNQEMVLSIGQILDAILYHLPNFSSKVYIAVTGLTVVVKEFDVQSDRDRLMNLLTGLERRAQFQHKSGERVDSPHKTLTIYTDNDVPPEDFITIPAIPTDSDFLPNTKPFVRKAKVKEPYKSVPHYLDVQFRLMRLDFIMPLKNGISELRAKKGVFQKFRCSDIRIYYILHIEPTDITSGYFQLKFDLQRCKRVDWENTDRLMTGSLICLSTNSFNTFAVATVRHTKGENLKQGILNIHLKGGLEHLFEAPSHELVMAESVAFFDPYFHVLESLKAMTQSFPLQNVLILCEPVLKPPAYLRPDSRFPRIPIYNLSSLTLQECDINVQFLVYDKWPDESKMCLNESQKRAAMLALTKEVAVIQGPPGTGKTYVGLKVVETLLKNKKVEFKTSGLSFDSPILVVCYTNHALDQFLDGIVKFCPESITRIGGGCKSEKLKKFILKNPLQRFATNSLKTVNYIKKRITQLNNTLQLINKDIMSTDELKSFMIEDHWWFFQTFEYDLKTWLFSAKNTIEKDLTKLALDHFKKLVPLWTYTSSNIKLREDLDICERCSLYYDKIEQVRKTVQTKLRQARLNKQSGEDKEMTEVLTLTYSEILPDDLIDKFCPKSFSDEIQKKCMSNVNHELLVDNKVIQFWLLGQDRPVNGLINDIEILTSQLLEDPLYQQDIELKTKVKELKSAQLELSLTKLCDAPKSKDGWKVVDTSSKFQHVMKAMSGTEPMTDREEKAVEMTDLNLQGRFSLYLLWIKKYREQLNETIVTTTQQLKFEEKKAQDLNNEMSVAHLKRSQIIGMTTTGAAKYKDILDKVGCNIVIVEEAAEVLESHIVTALSKNCQHLILIGDHQQLRPKPATYELEKRFNLDVSLFERLILSQIPHVTLRIQHRMRPEISQILNLIYPELEDHPSVLQYESIRGVSKDVFFINHHYLEEGNSDSFSKSNEHEAEYVVALYKYLIQQDYLASQITIITTYKGQVALIRRHISMNNISPPPRVSAVDDFQGEENEIILLSLVRSNEENSAGFVTIENRVCVALSRAKKGLFVIGNFQFLASKSKLWKNVIEIAEKQTFIGPGLPVQCIQHPENVKIIITAEDFKKRVGGGCGLPCLFLLKCGHQCQQKCHGFDLKHEKYRCIMPCTKKCEEGHLCSYRCHETCRCETLVTKILPKCGHSNKLPCHVSLDKAICYNECGQALPCGHLCKCPCKQCAKSKVHGDCTTRVDYTFTPCGHEGKVPCFRSKLKNPCDIPCVKKLNCGHEQVIPCHVAPKDAKCSNKCSEQLPCGHECAGQCIECVTKRKHPKCQVVVEYVFKSCEHVAAVECYKSKSNLLCDVPCPARLPCGHSQEIPCHQEPEDAKCSQKCSAKMSCGHVCQGKCRSCVTNKKHSACQVVVDYTYEPCGHLGKLKCHLTSIKHKCPKKCKISLNCGHVCTGKCSDCTSRNQHEDCQDLVPYTYSPCGHTGQVPCFQSSTNVDCPHNCTSILKCEHKCHGKCKDCVANKQHKECQVYVDYIYKPCGHQGHVPCSQSSTNVECPKPCTSKLECGHRCKGRCKDCVSSGKHQDCYDLVHYTFKPCGHSGKVPCNKSSTKIECNHPCPSKLKCGHPCRGTCSGCLYGLVHQPCHEKCNQYLPCGHRCTGYCSTPCLPCKNPCQYKCIHGSCKTRHKESFCGQPCYRCQNTCMKECDCQQLSDFKMCCEPWKKEPCSGRCNKQLKVYQSGQKGRKGKTCTHPCSGICGEKCVCSICEKIQQIKRPTQAARNRQTNIVSGDLILKLPLCNHVFRLNELDDYVAQNSSGGRYIYCPVCPKPLLNCLRYENINLQQFQQREKEKRELIERSSITLQNKRQIEEFKNFLSKFEDYKYFKDKLDVTPEFHTKAEFLCVCFKIKFIYILCLMNFEDQLGEELLVRSDFIQVINQSAWFTKQMEYELEQEILRRLKLYVLSALENYCSEQDFGDIMHQWVKVKEDLNVAPVQTEVQELAHQAIVSLFEELDKVLGRRRSQFLHLKENYFKIVTALKSKTEDTLSDIMCPHIKIASSGRNTPFLHLDPYFRNTSILEWTKKDIMEQSASEIETFPEHFTRQYFYQDRSGTQETNMGATGHSKHQTKLAYQGTETDINSNSSKNRNVITSKDTSHTPDNDITSKDTSHTPDNDITSKDTSHTPDNDITSKDTSHTPDNDITSKDTSHTPDNDITSKDTSHTPDNDITSKDTSHTPDNDITSKDTSHTPDNDITSKDTSHTPDNDITSKDTSHTPDNDITSKDTSHTPDNDITSKDTSHTPDNDITSKDTSHTPDNDITSKDTSHTPDNDITSKDTSHTPDNDITSKDTSHTPDNDITSKDTSHTPDNDITSKDTSHTPDNDITSKDTSHTPDNDITSKDTSHTPDNDITSKDTSHTPDNDITSKDTSHTPDNDITSKDTSHTPDNDITSKDTSHTPDNDITSKDTSHTPDNDITSKDTSHTPDNDITSKDTSHTPDNDITSKDTSHTPDNDITSKDTSHTPDNDITSKDTSHTPDNDITSKDTSHTPDNDITSKDTSHTPDNDITSKDTSHTPDNDITSKDTSHTPDNGITSKDTSHTPDNGITSKDTSHTPDNGITSKDTSHTPDNGITSKDTSHTPDNGITSKDTSHTPDNDITSKDTSHTPDNDITSKDTSHTPDNDITSKDTSHTPDNDITSKDTSHTPDNDITSKDTSHTPDNDITSKDTSHTPDNDITSKDTSHTPDNGITSKDTSHTPDNGITSKDTSHTPDNDITSKDTSHTPDNDITSKDTSHTPDNDITSKDTSHTPDNDITSKDTSHTPDNDITSKDTSHTPDNDITSKDTSHTPDNDITSKDTSHTPDNDITSKDTSHTPDNDITSKDTSHTPDNGITSKDTSHTPDNGITSKDTSHTPDNDITSKDTSHTPDNDITSKDTSHTPDNGITSKDTSHTPDNDITSKDTSHTPDNGITSKDTSHTPDNDITSKDTSHTPDNGITSKDTSHTPDNGITSKDTSHTPDNDITSKDTSHTPDNGITSKDTSHTPDNGITSKDTSHTPDNGITSKDTSHTPDNDITSKDTSHTPDNDITSKDTSHTPDNDITSKDTSHTPDNDITSKDTSHTPDNDITSKDTSHTPDNDITSKDTSHTPDNDITSKDTSHTPDNGITSKDTSHTPDNDITSKDTSHTPDNDITSKDTSHTPDNDITSKDTSHTPDNGITSKDTSHTPDNDITSKDTSHTPDNDITSKDTSHTPDNDITSKDTSHTPDNDITSKDTSHTPDNDITSKDTSHTPDNDITSKDTSHTPDNGITSKDTSHTPDNDITSKDTSHTPDNDITSKDTSHTPDNDITSKDTSHTPDNDITSKDTSHTPDNGITSKDTSHTPDNGITSKDTSHTPDNGITSKDTSHTPDNDITSKDTSHTPDNDITSKDTSHTPDNDITSKDTSHTPDNGITSKDTSHTPDNGITSKDTSHTPDNGITSKDTSHTPDNDITSKDTSHTPDNDITSKDTSHTPDNDITSKDTSHTPDNGITSKDTSHTPDNGITSKDTSHTPDNGITSKDTSHTPDNDITSKDTSHTPDNDITSKDTSHTPDNGITSKDTSHTPDNDITSKDTSHTPDNDITSKDTSHTPDNDITSKDTSHTPDNGITSKDTSHTPDNGITSKDTSHTPDNGITSKDTSHTPDNGITSKDTSHTPDNDITSKDTSHTPDNDITSKDTSHTPDNDITSKDTSHTPDCYNGAKRETPMKDSPPLEASGDSSEQDTFNKRKDKKSKTEKRMEKRRKRT